MLHVLGTKLNTLARVPMSKATTTELKGDTKAEKALYRVRCRTVHCIGLPIKALTERAGGSSLGPGSKCSSTY